MIIVLLLFHGVWGGIRRFRLHKIARGNADILGICGTVCNCQVGGYAVDRGQREWWNCGGKGYGTEREGPKAERL